MDTNQLMTKASSTITASVFGRGDFIKVSIIDLHP
jgi:hypothetical protein